MMEALFFDIETTGLPPPDWDYRDPVIGITCAAAVAPTLIGGDDDNMAYRLWWAGMNESKATPGRTARGIPALADEGKVEVNRTMMPDEVEAMLDDLVSMLSDSAISSGGRLFGWNTVNFDLPIIMSNVPHRKDDIVSLCLRSYDACFQFLRKYGWPIGLQPTAQAMLGREKAEGMDGAKAASIWTLQPGTVMRYVIGDVELLRDVVDAIMEERQVRWIKRDGKEGARPMTTWHTVKTICGWPEPSRAWMDDPEKFALEKIAGWMK